MNTLIFRRQLCCKSTNFYATFLCTTTISSIQARVYLFQRDNSKDVYENARDRRDWSHPCTAIIRLMSFSYAGMAPFVECMGCLHLETLHLGFNQISPAMCKMLGAAADRYDHLMKSSGRILPVHLPCCLLKTLWFLRPGCQHLQVPPTDRDKKMIWI